MFEVQSCTLAEVVRTWPRWGGQWSPAEGWWWMFFVKKKLILAHRYIIYMIICWYKKYTCMVWVNRDKEFIYTSHFLVSVLGIRIVRKGVAICNSSQQIQKLCWHPNMQAFPAKEHFHTKKKRHKSEKKDLCYTSGKLHTNEKGLGWKMYFLLKMGIFQPATLVYQSIKQIREKTALSEASFVEVSSLVNDTIQVGSWVQRGWLEILEGSFQTECVVPKVPGWKINENCDEYHNIIISSINISSVSKLELPTVALRVYGTAHGGQRVLSGFQIPFVYSCTVGLVSFFLNQTFGVEGKASKFPSYVFRKKKNREEWSWSVNLSKWYEVIR